MDNRALWEKTITNLRESISKPQLITWFKNTAIIGTSEDTLTVGIPNALAERQLAQKFNKQILDAAKKEIKQIKTIAYRVDPTLDFKNDSRAVDFSFLKGEEKPKRRKLPNKAEVKIGEFRSVMLDERYTLDNFVVGPDNRLAHAAASAVANNPGKNYNPLFIYGGVGMGKTHILQGIGNAISRKYPEKTVIYQTSETFTNELIGLIRKKKAETFKEKYRKADVLLIDDVQFFAKKERTQEEFFHTFNALYMAHKQIVLTADRPPKELAGLEDRLISRFEQGMVVDVQLPDYETRIAILQEKCHQYGVLIPQDVLDFIATNVTESVRELEGVLMQSIAEAELENTLPTVQSVAKRLKKTNKKKELVGYKTQEDDADMVKTLPELTRRAAEFFEIDEKDIKGSSKKIKFVLPRQIIMSLAREKLGYTLEEIGDYFGGRDHTTVLHAIKKVKTKCEEDKNLLRKVNAFKKESKL